MPAMANQALIPDSEPLTFLFRREDFRDPGHICSFFWQLATLKCESCQPSETYSTATTRSVGVVLEAAIAEVRCSLADLLLQSLSREGAVLK
jgi:hypothetical protein